MDWLMDNWYWVLGAIVVLYIIGRATQSSSKQAPARSSSRRTSRRSTRSPSLNKQQTDAMVALLLTKLTDALENVVNGTVGTHYTAEDRRKIAMGMVAVMVTEKVSLDRLSKDPALFAAVMLKSIAALTSAGQISAR